MQIDRTLMAHLADLSRLHFNEEEMKTMQADLEKMIGFVEKLNELDTTGVAPLMHMTNQQDVYRQDEAAAPLEVQKALENAAYSAGSFFQVPKVIA